MLTFTDRELQLILITIASFADSLFKQFRATLNRSKTQTNRKLV